MFSKTCSDDTLSLALAFSAGVWGIYWYPLRIIENAGLSGSWSVVFLNACPLLVLGPLLIFNFRRLKGILGPTLLAALMTGMVEMSSSLGRLRALPPRRGGSGQRTLGPETGCDQRHVDDLAQHPVLALERHRLQPQDQLPCFRLFPEPLAH